MFHCCPDFIHKVQINIISDVELEMLSVLVLTVTVQSGIWNLLNLLIWSLWPQTEMRFIIRPLKMKTQATAKVILIEGVYHSPCDSLNSYKRKCTSS